MWVNTLSQYVPTGRAGSGDTTSGLLLVRQTLSIVQSFTRFMVRDTGMGGLFPVMFSVALTEVLAHLAQWEQEEQVPSTVTDQVMLYVRLFVKLSVELQEVELHEASRVLPQFRVMGPLRVILQLLGSPGVQFTIAVVVAVQPVAEQRLTEAR